MRINNGDGFEEKGVDKAEVTAMLQRLQDQGRIAYYVRHFGNVEGTTWEVRLPAFGSILAMSNAEVVAFLVGTGV